MSITNIPKPSLKIGDTFKLKTNRQDDIKNQYIEIVSIGGRKRSFTIKFIDSEFFDDKPIKLSVKSYNKDEELNFDNFSIDYQFKKRFMFKDGKSKFVVLSFSNQDRQETKTDTEKIEEKKNINNINTMEKTSNVFFNRWISTKSNLKENSIKNYRNQFLYLTRYLLDDTSITFDTLPNTIEYLKTPIKVINKLKQYNIKPRTLKIYFSIIQQILQNNGLNKLYDVYNREIDRINTELEEIKLDHIKSESQEKNWIEWEKIQDIYDNYSKIFKFGNNRLENMKYMILSFLILFPVRRISDLRLLKLIYRDEVISKRLMRNKYVVVNGTDLNRNYNYLVDYGTKDNPKYQLVFFNYKTNKLYGEQVFNNISPRLSKIITEYIDTKPQEEIENNQLLFSKDNDEPYKQTDMTSFIIRYTKKIFGKEIAKEKAKDKTKKDEDDYEKAISPSLFRTLYCSHYYKINPSNRDVKDCGFQLAHSPEEQRSTYQKR